MKSKIGQGQYLLFLNWVLLTSLPQQRIIVLGYKDKIEQLFKNAINSLSWSYARRYKLETSAGHQIWLWDIEDLEMKICGVRADTIIILDKITKEQYLTQVLPMFTVKNMKILEMENTLKELSCFKPEWSEIRPPKIYNLAEL